METEGVAMSWNPDLLGQTVLITGAGRGLGKSMAEKLASCGARLALGHRRARRACHRRGPARQGPVSDYFVVDVSNRADFLAAAAKYAARTGRIDTVINNAMVLRYEPVDKITEEMLDLSIRVGIKGTLWGTQALLAHYDPKRGGNHHQHGFTCGGERLSEYRRLQPRERRHRDTDEDAGRRARPAQCACECAGPRISAHARRTGPQ